MTEINYEEFDKEVVEVCKAMNKVSRIQTTDSCCGHGKAPLRIFFTVDSIATLNRFMWAGCYRWWNWRNGFTVQICDGDVDRDSKILNLVLESNAIGSLAYEGADRIARGINEFVEEWGDKR